ncbi:MAG: hypothetical protein N2Z65_03605 [Clostridiales bacterium]|nr:hypothetical protein [Clostridiales bacterium]
MSNRHAFLLWLSVSIKGAHCIRIVLPIPLLILLGLADILEDLSTFIPIFYHRNEKRLSPEYVKQITVACVELLREIALHTEPVDLVDVDVMDEWNHVKVKCLLR